MLALFKLKISMINWVKKKSTILIKKNEKNINLKILLWMNFISKK